MQFCRMYGMDDISFVLIRRKLASFIKIIQFYFIVSLHGIVQHFEEFTAAIFEKTQRLVYVLHLHLHVNAIGKMG